MSGLVPWFVLSYPRCRTAWLSVFLQGAGVPCFHEAWKQAGTPAEMRALMESFGPGPVVNSDCSNIFFLDAIKQEFPEAKYLVIEHTDAAILASLKESYGDLDYHDMMTAYRAAFTRVDQADLRVNVATWDTAESTRLFAAIAGRPVPHEWLMQVSGMLVQLMPEQIIGDIERAARGEFRHIEERMRRPTWV